MKKHLVIVVDNQKRTIPHVYMNKFFSKKEAKFIVKQELLEDKKSGWDYSYSIIKNKKK